MIREEAEKADRCVTPGTELALGGQIVLARSDADARAIQNDTDWFWNQWGVPFGLGTPEYIIGDADTISRQIERAERIGTDEMFFLLGDGLLDHDIVKRTLETFSERVLPRFS